MAIAGLTLEKLNNGFAVLFGEVQKRGVVVIGEDDPSVAGYDAPLGSDYIRVSANTVIGRFQKIGPLTTEWGSLVVVGGGGTIAEVVVNGNDDAALGWQGRPIRVTSASIITLPITGMPNGFTFDVFRETDGGVSFAAEGGANIRTPSGLVTNPSIVVQYGWVSVTLLGGVYSIIGNI